MTLQYARIGFDGGPQDLAREVIARARRSAYPLIGYEVEEVREGAARLATMDPDAWADVWCDLGERHFDAARSTEDRAQAREEYLRAFGWFTLARWPTPVTARRLSAYERSRDAFSEFDRLSPMPAEPIEVEHEGESVTGLLQVPDGSGPFPLYVQIAGLDGWKEGLIVLTRGLAAALTRNGIAILSVDAPGTGQAAKITPDAWRSLESLILSAAERPEIDGERVVLYGGSFGGYWANALSFKMPDAFLGVVSHGGPLVADVVATGSEYLFDARVALAATVKGAQTENEAMAVLRQLDLRGDVAGRSAPMLVMNGAKDTLVPVSNLYTLLCSGETAKDAWVNPQGIHMGHSADWTAPRIFGEVALPWVYRRFNLHEPRR